LRIQVKANKFILIVHGTAQEIEMAKNILMQNKAVETTVHNETTGTQLLLANQ